MTASLHQQKSYKKAVSVSYGLPKPLIAFFIALICGALYAEYDNHTISKQFNGSKYIVEGWKQSIQKAFQTEKPKPTQDTFSSGFDVTPQPTIPKTIVTVTTKTQINYQKNTNAVAPTIAIQYKYVYPTYSFPTAKPGEPGSKEWEEEFQRKWDEMTKSNAEAQKRVEEAQRQFCEQNPDLCKR
jgi:hypothetical protein